MTDDLRKEYEEICLTEIADLRRDLEVVRERSDKLTRGRKSEKILYYSNGIMRLERILEALKPILSFDGAGNLKKEAETELRKYHLGRLRLLDEWLDDESEEHWLHEFEEEIKSFHASGRHNFLEYPSEEDFGNVWRWSKFPEHPVIKKLRRYEDHLQVYIFWCRMCHPIKTIIWFIKEILPLAFKKPAG